MKFGVALYGVTILCLLMVGPVGPCGPGTALGAIFLFGGMFTGLIAVLFTTGTMIAGLVRWQARRDAFFSMVTAVFVVAVPSAAYRFARPDGLDAEGVATWAVWAWPGAAAAVYLIAIRRNRLTTSANP